MVKDGEATWCCSAAWNAGGDMGYEQSLWVDGACVIEGIFGPGKDEMVESIAEGTAPKAGKSTPMAQAVWVACVSSGHVCEYLRSDLVFADGSALDALRPASAAQEPSSPAMPGTKVRDTEHPTA